MLWRGCVAFLLSDLMTTLTKILMDNFCPYFFLLEQQTEKVILNLDIYTLKTVIKSM